MKFSLPLSLGTPAALAKCLEELRGYQEISRSKGLARQVGGASHISGRGLGHVATELFTGSPNPAHPSEALVQEAITYLQEVQKQAKTIHITTVVELTTQAQHQIIQWFREAVSPTALLTFVIDTQIAGGAVVRTPYHVHDFSFATSLRAHQNRLLQGLQRG